MLRRYKKEDAKTIYSWVQDEDTYYKWSAGILGEYPISIEAFSIMDDREAFLLIDEEEIGFFTIRKPYKDQENYRIGFVIVNPEYRGKGYGEKLMNLAIDYINTHYHPETISLGVFLNNEKAIACYRRVGFEEVNKDETIINNKKWQSIEMELKGGT